MTSSETAQSNFDLTSRFARILGVENVLCDEDSRAEFSQDLIAWESLFKVAAVLRPRTTEQVVGIVREASLARVAIAPRGGGLSYTQGYVPSSNETVAVDLSALNEIHELSAEDLYVTAGAGATWQQVLEVTKPLGLRPLLRGPISGSHSTIGGAASQGIMGHTDGFLSFEIVLADGRVITTGTGASLRSVPFYRHFGPDLTGLFNGDTGAFGIKTKVTLKLERKPDGLSMASFSFPTLSTMVGAIVAISRQNLVPRLFGMDPLKTRSASKVSVLEAGQTLGSIVIGRSSVMKGLSDAVSVMRSGRGALDSADWGLHVHAEGVNQAAADAALERIRDICRKHAAREVSPNIAIALNARPYSIRGFVGLEGERFVPIHAMFPLSRAVKAAERIEHFFADNEKTLEEHMITTCCLAGMEQGVFVIEPMFYWPDELGPLHRRYLPAEKFTRLSRGDPNPKVREIVVGLRRELKQIFFDLGAIHGQIGKYYDFANAVQPGVYELLSDIKNLLDPAGRLNPGNFGWPAQQKKA